jgi:hypothetical protein
MITPILLAVLAVSDVTITIVDHDTPTQPIPDANFILHDKSRPPREMVNESSDPNGRVVVRVNVSDGNVTVSAGDCYQTTHKKWPINSRPAVIKMLSKDPIAYSVRTQGCYVQRLVSEARHRTDGTEYVTCRPVLESRICRGPGVPLDLPPHPLPPGWRYELVWVETWYDADTDQIGHRPYYRIAPIAKTHHAIPAPCGCR